MENDLVALKTKAHELPGNFMQRIVSLETRYKTIEKTIMPPKRKIPGPFKNAMKVFAHERDSARHMSDDLNTDDMSPEEDPLMQRQKATTLERQITAHKIKHGV